MSYHYKLQISQKNSLNIQIRSDRRKLKLLVRRKERRITRVTEGFSEGTPRHQVRGAPARQFDNEEMTPATGVAENSLPHKYEFEFVVLKHEPACADHNGDGIDPAARVLSDLEQGFIH